MMSYINPISLFNDEFHNGVKLLGLKDTLFTLHRSKWVFVSCSRMSSTFGHGMLWYSVRQVCSLHRILPRNSKESSLEWPLFTFFFPFFSFKFPAKSSFQEASSALKESLFSFMFCSQQHLS